jgi:hypothetical protein
LDDYRRDQRVANKESCEMTKTTGIALLSAAALLGPALANAAETLPWTFAQFGYTRADGGEDLAETDAYNVFASVGFAGKWHAQLEYTDGEIDVEDGDDKFDFDGYRVVVGAHPQITENTQLRADVTYFDYTTDDLGGFGNSDADTDGYGLGFGLRHAFSPKVEATVQAWYVEGDRDFGGFFSDCDSGSSCDFQETIIELQGRYNWTRNLSTGLTVALGGSLNGGVGLGGDSATFDARWSFGNNGLWDLM